MNFAIGRSTKAPAAVAVRPASVAVETAIEHTSASSVRPHAAAAQYSGVAAPPVGIRIIFTKFINSGGLLNSGEKAAVRTIYAIVISKESIA